MKIEKGMKGMKARDSDDDPGIDGVVVAADNGYFVIDWGGWVAAYELSKVPSWLVIEQPESPEDVVHEFMDASRRPTRVRRDGRIDEGGYLAHSWCGPELARLALRVKELEAQLAAVKP